MESKFETLSIIMLEILFGLCASSVILYRVMGWAFDFGMFSYRVFNISISLLIIIYLIYTLLKSQKRALLYVLLFSLFHFIEGLLISFWFKVVIHGLILVVVGIYYFRHKTIILGD